MFPVPILYYLLVGFGTYNYCTVQLSLHPSPVSTLGPGSPIGQRAPARVQLPFLGHGFELLCILSIKSKQVLGRRILFRYPTAIPSCLLFGLDVSRVA